MRADEEPEVWLRSPLTPPIACRVELPEPMLPDRTALPAEGRGRPLPMVVLWPTFPAEGRVRPLPMVVVGRPLPL